MAKFLLSTEQLLQLNCCLTSVIHVRGKAPEGKELVFIEHLLCHALSKVLEQVLVYASQVREAGYSYGPHLADEEAEHAQSVVLLDWDPRPGGF